jgi:hypothetical protein
MGNVRDQNRFQDGLLVEQVIRYATAVALVNTGAGTLVINEAIRREMKSCVLFVR